MAGLAELLLGRVDSRPLVPQEPIDRLMLELERAPIGASRVGQAQAELWADRGGTVPLAAGLPPSWGVTQPRADWMDRTALDVMLNFAAVTPANAPSLISRLLTAADGRDARAFTRAQSALARAAGAKKSGHGQAYDAAGRRLYGNEAEGFRSRYYMLPDGRELRISDHGSRYFSPSVDLVAPGDGRVILSVKPRIGDDPVTRTFATPEYIARDVALLGRAFDEPMDALYEALVAALRPAR